MRLSQAVTVTDKTNKAKNRFPPAQSPRSLRGAEVLEQYVAFLQKPERAIWQKPDDVVAALGLKGSETLVDVGAGSGYVTFRFAKQEPHGERLRFEEASDIPYSTQPCPHAADTQ